MNMEWNKLPDEALDWIHQLSFESLTEAQQRTILTCMDAATYQDMHNASRLVTKAQSHAPVSDRKAILLRHFDQKHLHASSPLLHLRYWQAAAAVLLAGCLTFSTLLLMKTGKQAAIQTASISDTVYLASPVSEVRIYDTVYLERQAPKTNRKQPQSSHHGVPEQGYLPNENELQPFGTIEQLNDKVNRLRHPSIRNDSVISRFGFVAM